MSYFLAIATILVKKITSKIDLKDLAEVLECLATINNQVLDRLHLKLKEVILYYRAYSFKSVGFHIKATKNKSYNKKVLDLKNLE